VYLFTNITIPIVEIYIKYKILKYERQRKERAEAERDIWAISFIFTLSNNITQLSVYRETMSSDQETT
jgi:hypothetical protein